MNNGTTIDPLEMSGIGPDNESLIYRSGIPTLRSSTHRVKYSLKNRKHDPNPKGKDGKATETTSLPRNLCAEDIFTYDTQKYSIGKAIQSLLQRCCKSKVGYFRHNDQHDGHNNNDSSNNNNKNGSRTLSPGTLGDDYDGPGKTNDDNNDCNGHDNTKNQNHLFLEEFVVPPPSVWRKVNGGCCEDAQKVLSDAVVADKEFLKVFDRLVEEVVVPYLKKRFLAEGILEQQEQKKEQREQPHSNHRSTNERNDDDVNNNNESRSPTLVFYCQRPPTLRLQPGPGRAGVKPHADSEYGHQHGELNFWLPLTDRELTGVDLWCESESMSNDYHPIAANYGEIISFHGSSCRHFVNRNTSPYTRVSLDFRIGVEGFFDPFWQMRGTTHDHGRKEIRF